MLDLRGLSAGRTALVSLRSAIDRLSAGAILEVQLSETDRLDISSWTRLAGHEVVADLDAGDHVRLFVRKGTRTRTEQADWGIRMPQAMGRVPLLRDWFQGSAATVAEESPRYYGFVPRGAVAEQGGLDYPYRLNQKADVWSDNLSELYEQAKTQQWDASRDIAWEALQPLPDETERAVCQLMTFLAENEYAALYIPAKFIPRINAQFIEPVLFLATIINDEARHIEAFTKRAMANGGGLQYSSALTQRSLLSLFVQEDYFRSSFLLHVLGEGTFLELLEFIERYAPDPVTADVMRRARLDEGRHVAYGIAHVREVLRVTPARSEDLVAAATERSDALAAAADTNPLIIESLALLAGGGPAPSQRQRGFDAVQGLFREMHLARVRRMLQVGLDPATAEKISQLHTPNFM